MWIDRKASRQNLGCSMILNLHLSLDPARHGCPQWLNQAWQVFQLLWIKVDIPMHHLPHSPQGFGSLSVHTKRSVSYTHLRAHETRHDLVCRLLLEKKKKK